MCVVNQDMMLAPDYLERLMEFMEGIGSGGAGRSFGGISVLRPVVSSRTTSSGHLQASFLVIDSLGLRVSKSRHVSIGDQGSRMERSLEE